MRIKVETLRTGVERRLIDPPSRMAERERT